MNETKEGEIETGEVGRRERGKERGDREREGRKNVWWDRWKDIRKKEERNRKEG